MQWEQVFATRTSRMKASEIRELLKLLGQPDIISFAGGIPDPALFPKDTFENAISETLRSDEGNAALQYSVSEGYLPLREWIVGEMGRLGVPCDPDNILITSGSQQALDYLGKLLLSPNDTALVGWPTYLGALGAFNAYEPNYQPLVPEANKPAAHYRDAAQAAGGQVKFAYMSVDFANPTGRTLNRAAREAMTRAGTSSASRSISALAKAMARSGWPWRRDNWAALRSSSGPSRACACARLATRSDGPRTCCCSRRWRRCATTGRSSPAT